MNHYFDVDIATEYGVNAAIILQNLAHWLKRNEANEVNFYDGNYWTYNSRKAFAQLFPYLSERQISTALTKLIDEGLVITGNYNKSAYDRTLWYALTEKGKSIMHFCKMENNKMENGNTDFVEPIPNNKPNNINTNNKPDNKQIDYQQIADMYNDICISFPKVKSLSNTRKKAIKARLKTYSIEDFKMLFEKAEASAFLKGGNQRNWSATFDWLIKDANMAKVLDGNYDNKKYNTNESFEPEPLETLEGTPFQIWK